MSLDRKITKIIFEKFKFARPISYWFSVYGIWAYAFFFFGMLLAQIEHVDILALTAVSFVVTGICTFGLRFIVKRPRPDFSISDYHLLFDGYSFPSAHASFSFSIACIQSLIVLSAGINSISILLSAVFFALAFFIACSRLVLGVHYVGDILVGALLGTAVSLIVFLV